MTPVMQTNVGGGNCFTACLASLLDLTLEQIPDFVNEDEEFWLVNCQKWLYEQNILLKWLPAELTDGINLKSDVHYIVLGYRNGNSKQRHAVIYLGDKLVHDPHPSGNGLTVITDLYFLLSN